MQDVKIATETVHNARTCMVLRQLRSLYTIANVYCDVIDQRRARFNSKLVGDSKQLTTH